MSIHTHYLTRCLAFISLFALPLSGSSFSADPAATSAWEQVLPDHSFPAQASRLPLQARLLDGHGRTLTLQQVLSGRPAVLVFVSDGCNTDCIEPLRQVTQALDRANQSSLFGQPVGQYRRVALSTPPTNASGNPLDTQAVAIQKQALEANQSWQLLSAPAVSTLAQLRVQGGLEPTPEPNGPAGLVFLSAQGEVLSRVQAGDLSPLAIEQALKAAEASQEPSLLTGSLVQAYGVIKEYGQYYPAVPMLAKLLGVLAFGLLLWGHYRPARSGRAPSRAQALDAQPR